MLAVYPVLKDAHTGSALGLATICASLEPADLRPSRSCPRPRTVSAERGRASMGPAGTLVLTDAVLGHALYSPRPRASGLTRQRARRSVGPRLPSQSANWLALFWFTDLRRQANNATS